MSGHNQRLGQFGEDAAASWYENHGYVVLDRNWRVPSGELDLVVANEHCVVFVEVKTRSSDRYGGGYAAVNAKKQRKLRQVASAWLASSEDFYEELRFDVVDVNAKGHLQVWEEAF